MQIMGKEVTKEHGRNSRPILVQNSCRYCLCRQGPVSLPLLLLGVLSLATTGRSTCTYGIGTNGGGYSGWDAAINQRRFRGRPDATAKVRVDTCGFRSAEDAAVAVADVAGWRRVAVLSSDYRGDPASAALLAARLEQAGIEVETVVVLKRTVLHGGITSVELDSGLAVIAASGARTIFTALEPSGWGDTTGAGGHFCEHEALYYAAAQHGLLSSDHAWVALQPHSAESDQERTWGAHCGFISIQLPTAEAMAAAAAAAAENSAAVSLDNSLRGCAALGEMAFGVPNVPAAVEALVHSASTAKPTAPKTVTVLQVQSGRGIADAPGQGVDCHCSSSSPCTRIDPARLRWPVQPAPMSCADMVDTPPGDGTYTATLASLLAPATIFVVVPQAPRIPRFEFGIAVRNAFGLPLAVAVNVTVVMHRPEVDPADKMCAWTESTPCSSPISAVELMTPGGIGCCSLHAEVSPAQGVVEVVLSTGAPLGRYNLTILSTVTRIPETSLRHVLAEREVVLLEAATTAQFSQPPSWTATRGDFTLGVVLDQIDAGWTFEAWSHIMLALADANERSALGPGRTLGYAFEPSGGHSGTAAASVDRLIAVKDELNLVGIIGPSWSRTVQAVGERGTQAQIPIVSPTSIGFGPADKSGIPWVMRTAHSQAAPVIFLANLIEKMGWETFAILRTDDGLDEGNSDELKSLLKPKILSRLGPDFIVPAASNLENAERTINDDRTFTLRKLARSGLRVVVVLIWDPQVLDDCATEVASDRFNMLNEHEWVLISTYGASTDLAWITKPGTLYMADDRESDSGDDRHSKRWGAISTLYNPKVHGVFDRITGFPLYTETGTLSQTDQRPLYFRSVECKLGEECNADQYGEAGYDAVMLFALGINSILKEGRDPRRDRYALLRKMLSTNLTGIGISGPPNMLDPIYQDMLRFPLLKQTQPGAMTGAVVGRYTGADGGIVYESDATFKFGGRNSSACPPLTERPDGTVSGTCACILGVLPDPKPRGQWCKRNPEPCEWNKIVVNGICQSFDRALPPLADSVDPTNGPNGRSCGPGQVVDEFEFDQKFTCNCTATKFEGANCDIEAVTSLALSVNSTSSVDRTTAVIVGVILGTVVLALLLAVVAYKYRMLKLSQKAYDFETEIQQMRAAGELLGGAGGLPREIKRKHVELTSRIGAGAFGEVWKGVLDESSDGGVPGYMVAIKTAKATDHAGAEELRLEATIMSQVTNHCNLVSLIGVVTSGTPLLLLLSLCEKGSLLHYLRSAKESGRLLPTTERLRFGIEIAAGMEHLSQQHFVHRDLAARNVLLDSTTACKVADFGFSRTTVAGSDGDGAEYYRSHRGLFPIRWTSPEAMTELKFTAASDAWSFAITMIEVYTDGERPYPNIPNDHVMQAVNTGVRCRQPALCGTELYGLLQQCWSTDPESRPEFGEIEVELKRLLESYEEESWTRHCGGRLAIATQQHGSLVPQYEYQPMHNEQLQQDIDTTPADRQRTSASQGKVTSSELQYGIPADRQRTSASHGKVTASELQYGIPTPTLNSITWV